MLGWRLLVSAILIPAFVGLFVLDHRLGPRAPVLLALAVLLAVRASYELVLLLRQRDVRPHLRLSLACVALVVGAGWGHLFDPPSSTGASTTLGPVALAYAFCVLLLFLKGVLAYDASGRSMETLGAELLVVSYAGVLTAVTAQLRWVAGAQAGYLVLGSLVIAAKCGDTGAYFLGRGFGRRKMTPRLSPHKTWAGAAGALLGSSLGGALWLLFATPRFDSSWQPPAWYWAGLFGGLLGVTGLIGDLAESLLKRDTGAKDSAALLPGMGGVLDLLDSVLFAGPVAYLLWQVLPLKTW